jgi:hypothetical protein
VGDDVLAARAKGSAGRIGKAARTPGGGVCVQRDAVLVHSTSVVVAQTRDAKSDGGDDRWAGVRCSRWCGDWTLEG